MYTLYVKEGCPYCGRVIDWARDNDVALNFKDIADDAVAQELIDRGGRRMVPYLVDEEEAVEMYESADIITYLNAKKS